MEDNLNDNRFSTAKIKHTGFKGASQITTLVEDDHELYRVTMFQTIKYHIAGA